MNVWDVKVLFLGEIESRMSIQWPSIMPPLDDYFTIQAPFLGFLPQREGQNILLIPESRKSSL